MRTEPMLWWGLVFALFMILFYACAMIFVLVVTVRDYIHRKDKDQSCDCKEVDRRR